MGDQMSLVCRGVALSLMGPLAVLCLVGPVLAGPSGRPDEKQEAEKVARKVARAQAKGRDAREEREALRHFEDEVADYADLHAKQLSKLEWRVQAEVEESGAAQRALAEAIAAKRVKAEPGDIFRPAIRPLFRRLIAEQLEGPDALAARKAILEGDAEEGEDLVSVVPRVNAAYPSGAAWCTVPPSVLLTLPPLPACLHYRFVGRDLILVDCLAQLIVDVLPDATPDLAVK